MKTLLTLTALFLAFNANAVNSNSSLDEIRGSSKYIVDAPKMSFGNMQTSVLGVCTFEENGTEMLHGGSTSECVEYAQQGEDLVCVRTAPKELVKNRTFEKTVCVRFENGRDNDCAEYTTITRKEKLDYEVEVFTHHRDGQSANPAFTKQYRIPAC